jgi:predicted transcriptional regulator
MDYDDKKTLFPPSKAVLGIEGIKTLYICDGLSEKEIAQRLNLSESTVSKIVAENKLPELRKAFVRQGISELQNVQVQKAQKLMDIESNFKSMRILQLESVLQDYAAYHQKHGHFYKLHPLTGEILKDMDGIPMRLKLPNITNEIKDLKESLSLSEGLKSLLGQIDELINKPSRDVENIHDDDVIEGSFTDLFKQRKD